nr:hypothetical protein [Oxalobacteraceae bacterium]
MKALGKDKPGDRPKAVASYTPALATVRSSKPAHCGDTAITDKTGGCNSKAGAGEMTHIDWPAREPGYVKSNGWCRLPSKTNQLTGMRKGSARVQGVAPKGWLCSMSGWWIGRDRSKIRMPMTLIAKDV